MESGLHSAYRYSRRIQTTRDYVVHSWKERNRRWQLNEAKPKKLLFLQIDRRICFDVKTNPPDLGLFETNAMKHRLELSLSQFLNSNFVELNHRFFINMTLLSTVVELGIFRLSEIQILSLYAVWKLFLNVLFLFKIF